MYSSNMSSTSNLNLSDSVINILDQERRAIWQSNPGWSEETRQRVWSKRTAEITAYLNAATTRRHLGGDTGGTSLALAQATDPGLATERRNALKLDVKASTSVAPVEMTRTNTSNSSYGRRTSVPSSAQPRRIPSNTGKRAHQQTAADHSRSYTFGSKYWPSTGEEVRQPVDEQGFFEDPLTYLSKLDNSSDSSHVANKRQKVEGFDPPSMSTYPYMCVPSAHNVSPSTSMSSYLSPMSFTSGEDMSRQTSMTNESLADGVGMIRVESDISACSDNHPFSFDEEDLAASSLSRVTEKPSSSQTTTGYHDSSILNSVGYGCVGSQDFSFYDTSPSVTMTVDQGYQQEADTSTWDDQDMYRTVSTQSSSGSSTAEHKANERRRKHIENGKRSIASKSLPEGPTSGHQGKADSKSRPIKPQEPGTKRKEPITKQPYVRPQHPKLYCTLCDEFPQGFRGEHELRRHCDRAHANQRKVWICVDPGPIFEEGGNPPRPLNICKQCKQRKQYNVYYNAAAHLRRAHFNPRKRGRKARGENRESRAGKAGGDWPAIDWLKSNGFLKEIEVSDDQISTDMQHIDSGFDTFDEEEYDDFDCVVPDSAIDIHHANLSAEPLGFPTVPLPLDFYDNYTTAMDFGMQYQPAAMEFSISAPPAMMSASMNTNINDHGSMYNLNFSVDTQWA